MTNELLQKLRDFAEQVQPIIVRFPWLWTGIDGVPTVENIVKSLKENIEALHQAPPGVSIVRAGGLYVERHGSDYSFGMEIKGEGFHENDI
jgi:hypothetical protein